MIGDKLYLWGGGPRPDLPKVHNNDEKRRLTSQVEVFNITSGKWDSKPTSGDPPLGIAGYVCTTFKEKIYYFGGWCYHDDCFHKAIFQLDTSTYTWTQLQPTNDRIAVMKRGYGGIMSTEYEGQHRLLIIGGIGPSPSIQVPQAQYYQLTNGYVSTNEHNLFDILTGKKNINTVDWESFVVKKIRTLDDVRKLITRTLLHIETFTVYNACATWWCYSV